MWFVTPNKAKERVGKSLARFLFSVCSLGLTRRLEGVARAQRAVVRVWRLGFSENLAAATASLLWSFAMCSPGCVSF